MAKKTSKQYRYKYPAFVDGKDGAYGVVVPDIPGCHGGGATIDEAIEDATSALAELAVVLREDNDPIPKPSLIGGAVKQYADQGGQWELVTVIPLLVSEGRSVRVNISADARTINTIDAEATLRGLTRSAFMVDATLEKIRSDA